MNPRTPQDYHRHQQKHPQAEPRHGRHVSDMVRGTPGTRCPAEPAAIRSGPVNIRMDDCDIRMDDWTRCAARPALVARPSLLQSDRVPSTSAWTIALTAADAVPFRRPWMTSPRAACALPKLTTRSGGGPQSEDCIGVGQVILTVIENAADARCADPLGRQGPGRAQLRCAARATPAKQTSPETARAQLAHAPRKLLSPPTPWARAA